MYKMPFFSTTKCAGAPFRSWVVRLVKVGECYECQKQAWNNWFNVNINPYCIPCAKNNQRVGMGSLSKLKVVGVVREVAIKIQLQRGGVSLKTDDSWGSCHLD